MESEQPIYKPEGLTPEESNSEHKDKVKDTEWERALGVHKVFEDILKEVSQEPEALKSSLAMPTVYPLKVEALESSLAGGSTIYSLPYLSGADTSQIIAKVFDKLRERGFEVNAGGVIDAGPIEWTIFVSDDQRPGGLKRLLWSCQPRIKQQS